MKLRRTVPGLLLALVVIALATTWGCSPEAERTRGRPGADVGNSVLPIELHGNRARNNPAFQTPLPGLAPRDARAVAGGG